MVTMGHRLAHIHRREKVEREKAAAAGKLGQRFLELLASRTPSISQAALARDLGVTPTTMWRYVKGLDDGDIDERRWLQLVDILAKKYGVDATVIRAVKAPALTVDTSLTPYLDRFAEPEQLEALIAILERSDQQQARDLLLVLARDRLTRR